VPQAPQSPPSVLSGFDASGVTQEKLPLPSASFPFASIQTRIDFPGEDRAKALCKIVVLLLPQLTSTFSIVSGEYLFDELIPAVYGHNRINTRSYSHHDLALLLTTLAIGALIDPHLPPYDEEAQRYYRLALSAAQSAPPRRTIVTVQCLHLMNIYHGLTGNVSDLKHSHRHLISGCYARCTIRCQKFYCD
jgi:hypothetical protein